LTGARGNSGAILAQFFQGLAEATRGKVRLSTEAFAQAATKAAEQARKAISNPQEGTIITVMKDWANHLTEHAPQTPDFVELFNKSLSKAKNSLAKTPDKLLILKKAGVVDAGAQGFVNILEGIVNFIEFGKVKSLKVIASTTKKMRSFNLEKVDSEINFQFCAECLLEGNNLDLETIKQKVTFLGDSLIIAGSKRKAHIHIHTDKPEDVFDELSEFGTIVKTKVDDMHKQHTKIKLNTHAKSIGLVTDSTCDLPPELIKKYNIQIVPIVIQVGEKSYLDQVEIKPKDFIHILETSNEKLSTSQPPPALFIEAYNKIAAKYESIISLQLEEIINRIKIAADNVKIFISIPTLKYLMRSGRLSKTKGFLGTLLNLKPILTVNSDGNIVEAAKVIGQKRVVHKTLDLAIKFAKRVKNPRFGITHVAAPELAQWYGYKIRNVFNSSKVIIAEASPRTVLCHFPCIFFLKNISKKEGLFDIGVVLLISPDKK
jgi:fatty acid-binding protein DegV